MERQIDYLCVDAKYRGLVRDAAIVNDLDLASDHRAVKIVLGIRQAFVKKKPRRKKRPKTCGWTPQGVNSYHNQLDAQLLDIRTEQEFDSRVADVNEEY